MTTGVSGAGEVVWLLLLEGSCREQTRDGHRGPREGGQVAASWSRRRWTWGCCRASMEPGPCSQKADSPRRSSRPVGTHGPAGLPDLAWKGLSSVPGGCLSTAWRPWGRLGTLWCLCAGEETGAGGPGSKGGRTWNPSAF